MQMTMRELKSPRRPLGQPRTEGPAAPPTGITPPALGGWDEVVRRSLTRIEKGDEALRELARRRNTQGQ